MIRRTWMNVTIAVLLSCWFVLAAGPRPAAAEGPELSWRMVGQVGGATQAVAVQGNYAYVGVGLRLVVLDVSYPTVLREVGATQPFPHFVEDIVVSGTLAYVAAGGAGLRVVDVSDPTHPTEIGAWDSPGYAEGLAVAGSTVYLADGPYGLRVLDVSDPTLPTEIGSVYDMNYAFDVTVGGSHAYIAAAGAGLLVADISDPANPLEVGSLDTPGYAYGVDVVRDTAYVVDGWEGLRVVNVSNPADPIELASYDTPGWALSVDVSDSIAYVADGGRGLVMVNVSDRVHLVEAGAYEISGVVVKVALEDGVAYVADRRAGLRVIDVCDVQSPTQVSLYSPLADVYSLDVQGDYAYVASGFNGLRAVDVSDPSRPREVGTYSTGSYASSVVVSGTYAYLGHLMAGPYSWDVPYTLCVVDISEPAQPITAGVFGRFGMVGSWFEIDLVNEVLFAADEFGLRLVDVSDPYSPTQISFIELWEDGNWGTGGVAIYGDVAYVSAGGRLNVVDISDLNNPSLVEVRDWPGLTDMTVAGNRAYAAVGNHGLEVVDISNPMTPTQIGSYDTPGQAESVTISGTLAYVSDTGGGVQVVDVSDPMSPTLAGAYDTPGYTRRTVVRGNYVYVADHSGGLLVLEATSNAHSPSMSQSRSCDNSTRITTPSLPQFATSPGSQQSHPTRVTTGYKNTSARYRLSDHHNTSSLIHHPDGAAKASGTGLRTSANTWTVTSAADSGPGTLRWCLENATNGDTITFDPAVFPPANPVTITLTSELPLITQSNLTIDASNAGLILDGGQMVEYGLHLASDGNTIKGLQVLNFAISGISVGGDHNTIGGDRTIGAGPCGEGNLLSSNGYCGVGGWGSYNVVVGNLIGTDINGEMALGNWIGVDVLGTDNRVGGTAPGERNIVSGNTFGVYIHPDGANDNVVIGNYIGTDITGTRALGNMEGVSLVWGSGNTVEGNIISGNFVGVNLEDPPTIHNTIVGNLIGTDATGTLALGNSTGVAISGADFNRIGGITSGERNVISGNAQGILVNCGTDNIIIIGNYIGTNISGAQAIGNGTGVDINANTQHNFIGGTTDGERNIISGNTVGIGIHNAGVGYNWVGGNYIGTDPSGTTILGNSSDGVHLGDYTLHNVIQNNLISGNGERGVSIDSGANSNLLRANRIGVAADGLSPLPNGMGGVRIEAPSNTVGDLYSEDGNTIAFNAGVGIEVCTYSGNTIRRNSIHSNAGKGIETTNGGNNMLPAPVITAVTETSVSGTACPGCTVEVFSDAEDEGRVYEGSATADASGAFTFSEAGPLTGPNITATATDGDGNTSEFSMPVALNGTWLPLILKEP